MRCAVHGCNVDNQAKYFPSDVKFFSFPRDKAMREAWRRLCGRVHINVENARVCSRHFGEEAYKRNLRHELLGYTPQKYRPLKKEAVPSRYMPPGPRRLDEGGDDFERSVEEKELSETVLKGPGGSSGSNRIDDVASADVPTRGDGDRTGSCDWCLQRGPVQTIPKELWRFWKIISAEDPTVVSRRSICGECKSRYEDFSTYVERCKTHASTVEAVLSRRNVKVEPSVDVEYHAVVEDVPPSRRDVKDRPNPSTSGGCDPSGRKALECPHCDRTFAHGSRLSIHLRSHTGDRPFGCPHCGKAFAQSNNLKSHLRVHTGDRPFECPHCKKTFGYSNTLKAHLHVHSGDKPFACSYCGERFTWRNTLKRHVYLHTGDLPFKCGSCDKSYRDYGVLKCHLRTHTGDRPFGCSRCGKGFAYPKSLRNHLLVHKRKDHQVVKIEEYQG